MHCDIKLWPKFLSIITLDEIPNFQFIRKYNTVNFCYYLSNDTWILYQHDTVPSKSSYTIYSKITWELMSDKVPYQFQVLILNRYFPLATVLTISVSTQSFLQSCIIIYPYTLKVCPLRYLIFRYKLH